MRYLMRMIRRMRLVALGIHATYVVALLDAADAAYTAGHGEPSGPLADWAAMDAAFATFVAAGILVLAWLHVIASVVG